jgi:hypothetical protein
LLQVDSIRADQNHLLCWQTRRWQFKSRGSIMAIRAAKMARVAAVALFASLVTSATLPQQANELTDRCPLL